MIKLLLLIVFVDIVLSQYVNNDGNYNRVYNQMNRELPEPADDYRSHRTDAYNQPKARSYQSEYKEIPMPYQFEYNIDDGYGNKQDRHEKADEYGNVIGSYGYVDSNGIYRKVDYTAGPEGFVAKINSNEPYLKHQANPAHVMYFVEDPPAGANNYAKRQANTYEARDEVYTERNDRYDRLFNSQIKDQIYRSSDSRVAANVDNVYDNNSDNELEKLKPFLAMLRPQYPRSQTNVNPNQQAYQSFNPNPNHHSRNSDDIQAYGSDRRYYD